MNNEKIAKGTGFMQETQGFKSYKSLQHDGCKPLYLQPDGCKPLMFQKLKTN